VVSGWVTLEIMVVKGCAWLVSARSTPNLAYQLISMLLRGLTFSFNRHCGSEVEVDSSLRIVVAVNCEQGGSSRRLIDFRKSYRKYLLFHLRKNAYLFTQEPRHQRLIPYPPLKSISFPNSQSSRTPSLGISLNPSWVLSRLLLLYSFFPLVTNILARQWQGLP
jgi:hypothetical protein